MSDQSACAAPAKHTLVVQEPNGSMRLPTVEDTDKTLAYANRMMSQLRGQALLQSLVKVKELREHSRLTFETFSDKYEDELLNGRSKAKEDAEAQAAAQIAIRRKHKKAFSNIKAKLPAAVAARPSEEATVLAQAALGSVKDEIDQIRSALSMVNDVMQLKNQVALYKKIKRTLPTDDVDPSGESRFLSPSKKQNMRRGVLMNNLSKSARQLPLWIGVKDETPPVLCGCMSRDVDYTCKPGEKVACNVRNSDKVIDDSGTARPMSPSKLIANESNQDDYVWFLGEVISYDAPTKMYLVDDIDGDVDERWRLPARRVLALPHYRADPEVCPEAIFKPDDIVLALYPQTTCFYRAIVYDTPATLNDDYMITFEDPSYPSGLSPPMPVQQRYVIYAPKQKGGHPQTPTKSSR